MEERENRVRGQGVLTRALTGLQRHADLCKSSHATARGEMPFHNMHSGPAPLFNEWAAVVVSMDSEIII